MLVTLGDPWMRPWPSKGSPEAPKVDSGPQKVSPWPQKASPGIQKWAEGDQKVTSRPEKVSLGTIKSETHGHQKLRKTGSFVRSKL